MVCDRAISNNQCEGNDMKNSQNEMTQICYLQWRGCVHLIAFCCVRCLWRSTVRWIGSCGSGNDQITVCCISNWKNWSWTHLILLTWRLEGGAWKTVRQKAVTIRGGMKRDMIKTNATKHLPSVVQLLSVAALCS